MNHLLCLKSLILFLSLVCGSERLSNLPQLIWQVNDSGDLRPGSEASGPFPNHWVFLLLCLQSCSHALAAHQSLPPYPLPVCGTTQATPLGDITDHVRPLPPQTSPPNSFSFWGMLHPYHPLPQVFPFPEFPHFLKGQGSGSFP